VTGLSIYAPLAIPTFTGAVTLPDGVTITSASSGYLKSSIALTTYAPIASLTFTGSVILPNGTTITQNSAPYLTSGPKNYLTTSKSISQKSN
jgi:hypothetical protein